MKRIIATLTLCLTGLPASAEQPDAVWQFDADDATMNDAIAAAQASLPLFLCAAVDSMGIAPEGTALKVRVPVEAENADSEIIWVAPFAAFDETEFEGFLMNQPQFIPDMDQGDPFEFTRDMIVDWVWNTPEGETFGGYTQRVVDAESDATDGLAAMTDPPVDERWTCEE